MSRGTKTSPLRQTVLLFFSAKHVLLISPKTLCFLFCCVFTMLFEYNVLCLVRFATNARSHLSLHDTLQREAAKLSRCNVPIPLTPPGFLLAEQSFFHFCYFSTAIIVGPLAVLVRSFSPFPKRYDPPLSHPPSLFSHTITTTPISTITTSHTI